MAEETENLTIRLLQEMCGDMRAMRDEFNKRLDGVDKRLDDVNARFDDLTTRVDGNTLMLNLLAGLLHDHENRLTQLEGQGR